MLCDRGLAYFCPGVETSDGVVAPSCYGATSAGIDHHRDLSKKQQVMVMGHPVPWRMQGRMVCCAEGDFVTGLKRFQSPSYPLLVEALKKLGETAVVGKHSGRFDLMLFAEEGIT